MITPQLELQVLAGNAEVKYISHAYGTTNFIPVPENKSIVITGLTINRSFNDPRVMEEYNLTGPNLPNKYFLTNQQIDVSDADPAWLNSILNGGITYQVELYSRDNVSTFTYALELVPVAYKDSTIVTQTNVSWVPKSITEHKDIYSIHKSPVYIRFKLRLHTKQSVYWMKNFLYSNNPGNDKTYAIDSIFSVFRNQAINPNPDLTFQTIDVLSIFYNTQEDTGKLLNYTPFTGNFADPTSDPSSEYTTQTFRFGIPNDVATNVSGTDTGGVAVPGGDNVDSEIVMENRVDRVLDAFFPFVNVEYVLLNYATGDNAVIPNEKLILSNK